MNTPVIIYGPQGCGKTINGKALAAAYGKARFVDAEELDEPGVRCRYGRIEFNSNIRSDTLYLTIDEPIVKAGVKATIVSFNEAIRKIPMLRWAPGTCVKP